MKKLTQSILEAKAQKLEVQDKTIGFIDEADLQKYLKVADKFLSDNAKTVVNWLIDNQDIYSKGVRDNRGKCWLAEFYNAGVPKDAKMKPLYTAIGKIIKDNRLLEIPCFQQEGQFEGILDGSIAPDEIILDLSSERGRNAVAKKYDGLLWKMAHKFKGKSRLSLDELYSAALEGFTRAMNNYGRKVEYNEKDAQDLTDEKNKKIKKYTFLSFAAAMIQNQILHDIANVSQVVRVPKSQQQKERREKGSNTKSNSISGDSKVKSDKGDKTVFDFMAGTEGGDSATTVTNSEDWETTWKEIFKELEDEAKKKDGYFDERALEMWYHFNELNGREKMKGKDLQKKYNFKSPSHVTHYIQRVSKFILKNKSLREKFNELRELMAESVIIRRDNAV